MFAICRRTYVYNTKFKAMLVQLLVSKHYLHDATSNSYLRSVIQISSRKHLLRHIEMNCNKYMLSHSLCDIEGWGTYNLGG